MPQAFESYNNNRQLTDDENILNLSWSLDEKAFLSIDLDTFISSIILEEKSNGLPHINSYMVKDPYGENMMASSISDFFSIPADSFSVTCGAGVITLLHGLAHLGAGENVAIIGNIYPDFPFWVSQYNGFCKQIPFHYEVETLAKNILDSGAKIIYLERPDIFGNEYTDDLNFILQLCKNESLKRNIVLIDESNANYYPPSFSAANLLPSVKNLIVMRGFSKAYSMGGLRFSYCVKSPILTQTVRKFIAPLSASSLSMKIGKEIISQGDITLPLREKIKEQKKNVMQLFQRLNIANVDAASGFIPYVFIRSFEKNIIKNIEDAGIWGKWHPLWSEFQRIQNVID